MVGLVIVSHSAKLAEGIKELAEQMTQGQGQIAAAGGIDDPENPFGTDVTRVQAAIESVYSDDGVVVLMDLGSAVLSAEMALEFLSPEQQETVKLCAAPLVEGAIAAAVQASVGGSLQAVMNEALGALAAKQNQLEPESGPETKPSPETAPPQSTADGLELTLTIRNKLGLHARPAANFVKTANRYQAEISVSKGNKTANAKSINQVAILSVGQGDKIVVRASGPEAQAALNALKRLVDNKFGEADEEHEILRSLKSRSMPVVQNGPADALVGIPASPGIAIGPVAYYRSKMPEVTVARIEDSAAEWARLQVALGEAGKDIEDLKIKATRQLGAAQAAIFEAQQMFLDDPALLDAVRDPIFSQMLNAEAAWRQSIDAMAGEYRALDDPYFRERAVDVIDVGKRVLRHLIGVDLPPLDFDQPSILLAAELTPSDTAQLNPANVLAICTEQGGATSHSAILAKALGIPAIVGLNGAMSELAEGQVIALDGSSGQVWPRPNEKQLADLQEQRETWLKHQQEIKALAKLPAMTRGKEPRTLEVVANIGGFYDANVALDFGAEGVGLFRTEFLFLGRSEAPTEAEQLQAYSQVAQAMGEQPLVIRTLDVGGDKLIPYLEMDREENPFLGQRGIRYCLEHPDILKPQLRAILQASVGHNVKVMFPMISSPSELRAAKAILAEVKQELQTTHTPFDENMEVGIMVEVPSAVAMADHLAKEADFFSIGSNDLSQYVMGADRGNRNVSNLVNALHPAVLRMIAQTVEAAHKAHIWAGICGELAGNVLAAPVLVGLGLDELSMNAPHIPEVKSAVRKYSMKQAKQIAQKALTFDTAEAVQTYLEAQAR